MEKNQFPIDLDNVHSVLEIGQVRFGKLVFCLSLEVVKQIKPVPNSACFV